MYIIYDTKTGEYQTSFGDWVGVGRGHLIHHEANVFDTVDEAERMITTILEGWDKRHTVPPREEFMVREVRSAGWELV